MKSLKINVRAVWVFRPAFVLFLLAVQVVGQQEIPTSDLCRTKSKGVSADFKLNRAIAEGNIECFFKSLEEGANPNSQPAGTANSSPLIVAMEHGNSVIIDELIRRGARVNGEVGVLALYVGSSRGHLDAVRRLVDKGSDVNGKVKGGATPLMGAAYHGHEAVVNLLLKNGARTNDSFDEGKTSLMLAADNVEILSALIRSGARINSVDKNGWTALFHAVKKGQLTKIQLLLENGAEIQKGSLTAFQVADTITDPLVKQKVLETLNKSRK